MENNNDIKEESTPEVEPTETKTEEISEQETTETKTEETSEVTETAENAETINHPGVISEEEMVVDEVKIAKEIDTYLIEQYRTSPQKKTPEALCKFLTETYGVFCASNGTSPHFVKILVGEQRIAVPFQNDQLVSVIVASSDSAESRVEAERIEKMDPLEVFAERIAAIIEERRSFIRPLFTKVELAEVIQRSANHPEFEFDDKVESDSKKSNRGKLSHDSETAIVFKSGEGEGAKQCRLPGEGYFKYQR